MHGGCRTGGALVDAYVAEGGESARDAVREFIADGVGPGVAALYQQSLREAATDLYLKAVIFVIPAIGEEIGGTAADRRIHLEQVTRIARADEPPHLGGIGRDGIGERACLSL